MLQLPSPQISSHYQWWFSWEQSCCMMVTRYLIQFFLDSSCVLDCWHLPGQFGSKFLLLITQNCQLILLPFNFYFPYYLQLILLQTRTAVSTPPWLPSTPSGQLLLANSSAVVIDHLIPVWSFLKAITAWRAIKFHPQLTGSTWIKSFFLNNVSIKLINSFLLPSYIHINVVFATHYWHLPYKTD